MKAIGQALVLTAAIFLATGCVSEKTPVLYRTAGVGDKKTEVLYISPFLALIKGQSSYSISRAHWLNDPDTADFTGDLFDAIYVDSVHSMNQSKSQGLLFGRGYVQNPEAWRDSVKVNPTNGLPDEKVFDGKPSGGEGFFIITYDKVVFFKAENEMNDYLQKAWNISHPQLEPVDLFFEKQKLRTRQHWLGDTGFDLNL